MKYANAAAPSTPFAFILDTTSSVTPAVASLKYALSSSLAIVSSWPYQAAADAPNLSASSQNQPTVRDKLTPLISSTHPR